MGHMLKATVDAERDQLERALTDPSLPLHPGLVAGLDAFLDELAAGP